MDKPFAITLDVGSSLANHTGSWRTSRPVYVDRLPPCNAACPAGENIQAWLFHAESGDYEAAWRVLSEDNPLPAIMGRVCYHPCQGACNRGKLDEAVGINAVERFLGDEAIKQGWAFAKPARQSGKRVLVVGAGPSGLSAAYHLARMGHQVEIHEAGPLAGGMMRFGIPKYRLPREVLEAEVQRILDLGVALRLGTKVERITDSMETGAFDAAFLAVGAHIGKRAFIPAGDAARIMDAVSLLRSMEGGEKPLLGRKVVVYGGGNTAIDAARTARRLGATEAIIVYRRTRDRMPAHDFEVEEALQEGVMIKWLSTIKRADEGSLTVERMELDASGFPQPTGEFETIEADSLVLALGQDVDLSLLQGVPGLEIKDGVVQVSKDMMTGHPGIFAGGDMVPSERTVTVAVGHGKKAARHIDAWLNGTRYLAPAKHAPASFDHINTWYYTDAPHQERPTLDAARRQSNFEEVKGGLTEDNALFEARRCLSCGNCFECDNCYGVCPDNAVIKLGPGQRFRFNYDYCKGCGLCVAECPCGAIEMEAEQI
ncbi:NAD(P)-binding protein [Denitratisoma oestradiolicum]|uniref:Glutamate synthase [NADPH] small chain n=1 Tax=Denitratisoma oestradiolicum TaxID=311182 RepID=A0A6S6XWR6_9PROT|nr:NAD(P)-binding protein [Denitratisoma oestradiolicum]TWO81483.1 glutamate synthase [Denitratisoma oestradiolicum]CAB1368693.1 Glutamate synthase [NADPH] small chain [Denitratisoma oestradiolicum]